MKYTDKSETLLKYQKAKAKLIEYDVAREEYPNFPINSNDLNFSTVYMLLLVVDLYVSLYGEKIKKEELLLLCQEWIKGTMPLEMLSETSFKEVDELMNICNNTISFDLSFLVGNIIDLLPEMDDEEAASALNSGLSLLQRKLKYGVPNLTAISICESVFWDRYIAIEIARLIQDESVTSSDLDVHLILNKDRICAYLEGMPSYFSDRFDAIVNKKAGK